MKKHKSPPPPSASSLYGLREYTDRTLKAIYQAYAENPKSKEFGSAESERYEMFVFEMRRRGFLQ